MAKCVKWRTLLLTAMFVASCFFGPTMPKAYAWDVTATPVSRITTPGGTVTFTVSVLLGGAEPPLPPVTLLVSPPVLGITTAFSPNVQFAPFNSVMTVHVDISKPPGVYTLDVWAWPEGVPFPGPGNRATSVQVIVQPAAPPATDWTLTNPTLSPASPNVGDPVTFSAVLRVLSTNQPYPQSVTVVAQLDGAQVGGGTVDYPGPTGIALNVYTAPPWTATAGTHTITWFVAPGTLDPNSSNNQVSRTFTVAPPPAQFDFEIFVSPTEQTVTPSSSATYSVTVNLLSGSSKSVTLSLSGEPAGVTKTFAPSSGNPTFSSSLTLSVGSSVSPGSYSMTVTGNDGGKTRTAQIKLIVSRAKDFRIDVSPSSQTVSQGQMVSYSVNVVGLNGFNSEVSLSVTGLPPGSSRVFSVPSGTPDFLSTMTVTLPSNVQTGSFTLTITGSGGGLDRVANVLLVITTATQTQTQTQTQTTTTTPGFSDMIQQNSLLLIGLLVLVIVALLALFLRGRRPSRPPPPSRPCPTCGKALTYVKEYDRWYCNNCKEYR